MIGQSQAKTRWSWRAPVIALLVLPLSTCGACYAYNAWWWAAAETAIEKAVTAIAAGRAPRDISVQLDSSVAVQARTDFSRPYTIEGADNFLAGTRVLDLLSPGVFVAHLKFPGGHAYHTEAQRIDGRWSVSIAPAEGE